MEKVISTQVSVGSLVAENFAAAEVFSKYGIDFCCNGHVSLAEACAAKGVSVDQILNELNQVEEGARIDFASWPIDLLIDYVLKIHHRGIRQKGPQMKQLLDKVASVHGDTHPELYTIQELFEGSLIDLNMHLQKEENVLFPYVLELFEAAEAGQPAEEMHCGSVAYPIDAMMAEHDNEGERYRTIDGLTNHYTAPADACDSYRLILKQLHDFEKALHEHIHLENNIIFPRAIELEKKSVR
ncbi:MAG TPA: iron-sulfur cluster repair di-iron protein [Bacteroides graminisolvens]|jgi:regulator of cell morphogenesis and NO signaling|nr:iron-sulfur cluster repair di-iron protein [Bacteroides graminisolvens]